MLVNRDDSSEVLKIEVTVSNSGAEGQDVVLAFMKPPKAGYLGRPLKSLVDFSRVQVNNGGTADVTISIREADFMLTNVDGLKEVISGPWTLSIGEEEQISIPFQITSN